MRHLSRMLAALLLGGLSLFAAGSTASAATNDCHEASNGYPASGVCAVKVTKAEAVCLDGVVTLTYDVMTSPATATTIDLRWVNPAGPAFEQTGLPLTGTVAWPASIPKVALDVQFISGATATVHVDPTAANATCSTSRVLAAHDPTASTSSRVLAATGAEILPFVVIGGGLLLVGIALVVTRTMRHRRLDSQQ